MSLDTKSMNLIGSMATESSDGRPLPENTFYVSSQEELESKITTDLIIPSNTNVAIIIDKSFTLTKPIKKQVNSGLFLYSQSSLVTLTYIGSGALLQMDGDVIGNITQIENIVLAGNLTNTCLAVQDSFVFTNRQTAIQAFARIGFLKGTNVVWKEVTTFACAGGMDFINCPGILIADGNSDALGFSPKLTLFSFISDVQMDVVFRNSLYLSAAVHDEFIFIDPNMPVGGSVSVSGSGILTTVEESLYQKGVDIAVTAVSNNGMSRMRCVAANHGQVNGTYAVLSGFTEPTYNKTALITVIASNIFDVEEIVFTGGDSGNINRSSLNSEDPRVLSLGNPDQSDSMLVGSAGLEVFGSEITSVSLAQGEFEVISSVNWQYANLESFEEDLTTPNQGRLIAKDFSKRKYDVKYGGTLEKSSGGSTNIGFILLKDGVETSFNAPHTVNSGKVQISGDDLILLAEDDTLQIAVKNYDSAAAVILTSQASLVISKG